MDKVSFGSRGNVRTTSSLSYYNQLLFIKDVLMPSGDVREDSLTSKNASNFSNETEGDETYDNLDDGNVLHSSEDNTEKDTGIAVISACAMADEAVPTTKHPGTLTNKPAPKNNESRSQTGKQIDYLFRRANISKRKLNAGTEWFFLENTGGEILAKSSDTSLKILQSNKTFLPSLPSTSANTLMYITD